MVTGVTEGYEKRLVIEGVGYRAELQGDQLMVVAGYTHPVYVPVPEGVQISVENETISVSGIDKETVGEVASKIRAVKPPEPYKGKGIRYENEEVRRKEGKSV
jgi:large subunit ribosomal protein L6